MSIKLVITSQAAGLGRGVAGLPGVGTGFRERFWGQAQGTIPTVSP